MDPWRGRLAWRRGRPRGGSVQVCSYSAIPTTEPAGERFALSAYPDSGYFVLDQPLGRLIADFGAPGLSENPGHQHAGIFSYEVSTAAGRLIVDRGTSTYAEGPEREALRGTGAHNTVRIDGTDQFELWKSFRVGRRASVHAAKALYLLMRVQMPVARRRGRCSYAPPLYSAKAVGIYSFSSLMRRALTGWVLRNSGVFPPVFSL